MQTAKRIEIIDTHTAGEPTRVVIRGGPELGQLNATLALDKFRDHHDRFRSAIVNEPRGSDVMVGALVRLPIDPGSSASVIFFNNVGYLGMCGHGMIGVIAALEYLGRISQGFHHIETPVGRVTAQLHPDSSVTLTNVPSYRKAADVVVEVPGVGQVRGDVAWGGNWFFLTAIEDIPLKISQVDELTNRAWAIRKALNTQGFPEVDHVELFGPAQNRGGSGRNFVLCPGRAYDRSPCGTGTSAKIACLAANGKLAEDETWTQEGILGTSFKGRYRKLGDQIVPTITGKAWITGETTLLLDENDPFCWGIRQ